jgi:hypothetical protein
MIITGIAFEQQTALYRGGLFLATQGGRKLFVFA